jgi:Domain of unknown function (DUF397)
MDLSHAQWHKSSRSGAEGNCIEVAFAANRIFTRDSKNPTGSTLSCNQTEWTAFLGAVRNGTLDLC